MPFLILCEKENKNWHSLKLVLVTLQDIVEEGRGLIIVLKLKNITVSQKNKRAPVVLCFIKVLEQDQYIIISSFGLKTQQVHEFY